jgi:hypothetical protein
MSLYDMYFSKKNKNYMFEMLAKVIQDETDIDISHSSKYIDLYRLHYSEIFETMSTDEISILNKEIIDRIGNLILMDLRSKPILKPASTEIPSSPHHNRVKKPIQNQISLYSSQRLNESSQRELDSQNRYHFSLSVDFNEFQPKSITLLKEQNSLFSNPNINILFNDTDNLLFKLKDIQKLDDNEYHTYECITEDKIQCSKFLKIRIRNYMMIDPLQESDIYPINQIKSISYEGKDYLCLQIDDHDIIEGEELGLLSDNKIGKSLFVKKVLQNYLLTSKEKIDFNLNYSCLQLNKNITIEGLV